MRTANIIKTAVWITLLAGMSVAGIKYVAVVESDIDEGSGASENISRADVRLVTAELRREAVKNLPPKRYVIMTAETVMAQGGAVLEECADENCVITLGSKIGADYIVRGTVSKLESKFTLQVEMYETENGNLVASCDPVRSESIGELVEKASEACANMYKTWLAAQSAPEPEPQQAAAIRAAYDSLFVRKKKIYIAASYALINTPAITSELTPALSQMTFRWFYSEFGGFVNSGPFPGFAGFDVGVGIGTGYDRKYVYTVAVHVGPNACYTLRLPAGFALSLGGTAGIWYQEYDKENEQFQQERIESNLIWFYGLLVKARWKFIEVTYKGISGYSTDEFDSDSFGTVIDKDTHSCWVNQVRVGLYFEL